MELVFIANLSNLSKCMAEFDKDHCVYHLNVNAMHGSTVVDGCVGKKGFGLGLSEKPATLTAFLSPLCGNDKLPLSRDEF